MCVCVCLCVHQLYCVVSIGFVVDVDVYIYIWSPFHCWSIPSSSRIVSAFLGVPVAGKQNNAGLSNW